MKIEIVPIDLETLIKSKSLLESSYVGQLDMADEIEYFKSANHAGWFVALDEGKPAGFIRQFIIVDGESRGEIFVLENRLDVAELLAKAFINSFNPTQRTRVSFVFRSADAIAKVFKKCGLAQAVEEFLSYIYPVENSPTELQEGVHLGRVEEAEEIKKALSGLVDRPIEQLKIAIAEQRVFVLKESGKVLAASECRFSESKAEIVTLAVKDAYRSKGLGTRLLKGIVALCEKRNVPMVHAVCRESNIAAQRMNVKAGFERDKGRDEEWLISFFGPDDK